jgi:hypothetical protein
LFFLAFVFSICVGRGGRGVSPPPKPPPPPQYTTATVLENVRNHLPSDMTCIFSSTAVTQPLISHVAFILPIAYIISPHTHFQTFCLWFIFLVIFLISHHIPRLVTLCLSSCNDFPYMYFHSIVSIFPEWLKNTIMFLFLDVKFK